MFRVPTTSGRAFINERTISGPGKFIEFCQFRDIGTLNVAAMLLLVVAVDSKSFIFVNLLILVNQC